MGFGAVNGTTNLTSRLDLGNSGALSWSAGAANVDYTLAVKRASPDNPDGPFSAAKIGVAPSDGDGVALASAAYDMDVDNNSVNEHKQVGASTQLLFGRLMLRNALGAEDRGAADADHGAGLAGHSRSRPTRSTAAP